MTREHVIPAFLYKQKRWSSDGGWGWNEKAKKQVQGEAKIKDVCANCNNGPLSELDAYGARFLSDNGLNAEVMTQKRVSLKYDFDALLRWILKISFNSARATEPNHNNFDKSLADVGLPQQKNQTRFFGSLKAYILSGDQRPTSQDLMLFARLYKPEKLSAQFISQQLPGLPVSNSGLFNPVGFGSCSGLLCTPSQIQIPIRGINLGYLDLFVAFPREARPYESKNKVSREIGKMGSSRIRPTKNSVIVKACNLTQTDRNERQYLRHISLGGVPDDWI